MHVLDDNFVITLLISKCRTNYRMRDLYLVQTGLSMLILMFCIFTEFADLKTLNRILKWFLYHESNEKGDIVIVSSAIIEKNKDKKSIIV